jgi:hypothetical protein
VIVTGIRWTLRTLLTATLFGAAMSLLPAAVQAQSAPGGFTESATGNAMRPRLSAGQIQTFMPARGRFTFPAPYGTTGVRLTNASDCGGRDCVNYVGYSYWRNINNHAGSDTLLAFLGLDRSRGGAGPTLFSYNKRTGETQNLGPLFSSDSPFSWASGEGWYFSATRPNTLYVTDSNRLLRYDVVSRAMETVFDVREHLGADRHIRQMHSSSDDRVHSATVQDGSWNMVGCVAYIESQRRAVYIARKGDYDECQVDKSGRWLVLKEDVDGRDGEDNRIIDLQTGAETVFLDRDGAAGHSDLGFGYLVAEDNMHPQPGAARVWQLGTAMNGPGQGALVYQLTNWSASAGLGHLTFGNARNDVAINQQMACSSSAERSDLPRVNEIVCYRLDGSLNVLVVAPNMTDLNASGGGGDDYSKRPKGNLDPTGEYFIWTSNLGGSRNDAIIVRIPQARLGVSGGTTSGGGSTPAPSPTSTPTPTPTPTPSPSPSPAPSPAPAPAPSGGLTWMSLVNIGVSGSNLTKTGGCSGCADATGVSQQQLSTTGSLTFTTPEEQSLRFVGLGAGTTAAPSDINFAIRLQGGVAEVRELGGYKADVRFGVGDTFRISVDGGVVSYAKNGSVFYTSATRASYQTRVHVVLFESGSIVGNVAVGGGSTTSTSAGPAPSVPSATTVVTERYAIPRPEGSVPVR